MRELILSVIMLGTTPAPAARTVLIPAVIDGIMPEALPATHDEGVRRGPSDYWRATTKGVTDPSAGAGAAKGIKTMRPLPIGERR